MGKILRAIAVTFGIEPPVAPEPQPRPMPVERTGRITPVVRPYTKYPRITPMSNTRHHNLLIQLQARDRGLYNGPCDGEVGENTRRAARMMGETLWEDLK